MSLSVFRSQKRMKSVRSIRNFCTAVSSQSIGVLKAGIVRNWFWIPLVSRMCCEKDSFLELHHVFSKHCVNANFTVLPVKRQHFAKVLLSDKQGVTQVMSLSDSFWAPDHSRKLLSVRAPSQKCERVVFVGTCKLRCYDKVFSFLFKQLVCVAKEFSVFSAIFLKTHKIVFDHNIMRDFWKLSKSAEGIKLHSSSYACFCDICAEKNSIVKLLILRLLHKSVRKWNWFFWCWKCNGSYFFAVWCEFH